MKLAKFTADQWAITVGAGVFLAALGWLLLGEREVGRVADLVTAEIQGVLAEEPALSRAASGQRVMWAAPAVSDDPEAWGFDLFTPPIIYYDPETGRFSVASPEAVEVTTAPMAQPFGVRLVRVERQPYRLQLVGYAGTPEDPLGIFANEVSGEGIVARAGHRFGDLGIALESLVIRREELIVPESMPLREVVAEARIRDGNESRERLLSSNRPAWTDQPAATIIISATGEQREVVAGNQIELPSGVIEITGVYAGPDTVTAVKQLPDGTRESQRLEPEMQAEAQFGGDSIFESP